MNTAPAAAADDPEEGRLDLADAFNDLMYGAAKLAPPRLNGIERQVEERVTNTLMGAIPLEDLPKLPAKAAELMQRLNDPDVDVEELAALVNQDASIAAEMLRLANSAYFRRTRQEITDIQQAFVSVGFNGVKAMLTNVLLKPVVAIKPVYFRMFGQQLWDHSQECALACSRLAKGMGSDPYQAYLLGLIHDVGKIVIFQLLVGGFRSVAPNDEPRPHAFVKLIAGHSMHLSHLVAQNWSFPRIYMDALREQKLRTSPEQMSDLARTLFYGNLLTEAYTLVRRDRFPLETVDAFLKGFGMNVAMMDDIFPGLTGRASSGWR